MLLTELQTEHPIFCPKCRTLNADEVHFCVQCGERLKVDCVMCHYKNRIDTPYCARCGVHLQRARQKRHAMRETSQSLRAERLAALKEKEARQQQEKIERLVEALDEPENHDLAILQLSQLGAAVIEILIETLLRDEDVDARYGSARTLGQIMAQQNLKKLDEGRQATLEALVQALVDPELPVRYWAAEALGKCNSPLAIAPLTALLDEQHKGLRQVARTAIENIGGPAAEAALAKHKPHKLLSWLSGK